MLSPVVVNPPVRALLTSFAIFVLVTFSGCGAKVDTGHNDDPQNWPKTPETENSSAPPSTSDQTPGPSDNASTTSLQRSSCFLATSEELNPAFQQVCEQELKTEPAFAKIHHYLCEKKFLTKSLKSPECGWKGDPAKLLQHVHFYEREPESSGKNYEDVHATIIHTPVKPEEFLRVIHLVFENYNEFIRQGYHWISGTRENSNLNAGTLETGVQYNFVIERDAYELGYSGRIRLIQLDNDTWVHLNYADGHFTRVTGFAQVVFYSRQADGTVLTIKIENKSVESRGGLYNKVWKGALELLKDLMIKSWQNSSHSLESSRS